VESVAGWFGEVKDGAQNAATSVAALGSKTVPSIERVIGRNPELVISFFLDKEWPSQYSKQADHCNDEKHEGALDAEK
jgi:hypothetical protein